jgi:hypothetical protein
MEAQVTVEIPRAFLAMTDPRRNNSKDARTNNLTIWFMW